MSWPHPFRALYGSLRARWATGAAAAAVSVLLIGVAGGQWVAAATVAAVIFPTLVALPQWWGYISSIDESRPPQVDHHGRTPELAEQGQATDGFTRAVEQLASPATSVRIGGILVLGHIARDSIAYGNGGDHPAVMALLAAFIREHSHDPWPEDRPVPGWAPAPEAPSLPPSRPKGQPPRPDVVTALTVIGHRDPAYDDRRYPIDLTGANLSVAVLKDMNFAGVDFYRANLTGTELHRTDLTGARLVSTVLNLAELEDANLTGANLTWAVVTKATLDRANLSGADLAAADFTRAKLPNTDLSGANLRDTNFQQTDLSRVVLGDADLGQAEIDIDTLLPPGWWSRQYGGHGTVWAVRIPPLTLPDIKEDM